MCVKQKTWLVFSICLISLALVLTGCGGGGGDKAAAPAKTQNINIATATTGGVYYPLGNAWHSFSIKKSPA